MQPPTGGPEQYGGVLIRGATGRLWYMSREGEQPELIEDDELEKQVSDFVGRQPEGMMTFFPLPEDIRERLARRVKGGVVAWGVVIIWSWIRRR